MSTPSFPPQGPWMQLPLPGMPGVELLQRQISPEENADRASSAYWARLARVGLWMLVTVAALLAFFGIISRGIAWVALFPAALGFGIGVPIGLAIAKRQAEAELGFSREMTVAWNAMGFSILSPRGVRSVPFSDIRRVSFRGPDGWFVAVYTPVQWLSTDPNVLLIPRDLVPAWALTQLAVR